MRWDWWLNLGDLPNHMEDLPLPPQPSLPPQMDLRGKNPNMEKGLRDTLPKRDWILRSFRKLLASLQMEIGQWPKRPSAKSNAKRSEYRRGESSLWDNLKDPPTFWVLCFEGLALLSFSTVTWLHCPLPCCRSGSHLDGMRKMDKEKQKKEKLLRRRKDVWTGGQLEKSPLWVQERGI